MFYCSVDEMRRYCAEVSGPKLANCLENGLTPVRRQGMISLRTKGHQGDIKVEEMLLPSRSRRFISSKLHFAAAFSLQFLIRT